MATAAAAPKTNVLSIVGMILSLLGLLNVITWGWAVMFLPGGFLTVLFVAAMSIAGVICSHIAMKQIKARSEGGRGMALTGVITGWIGIGLVILQALINIVVTIGVAASSSY